MEFKTKEFIHQLKHHSPFTIGATVIALLVVVLLKFVLGMNFEAEAFEILHPVHLIASAMVTAAIYYKYNKNILMTLFVGIIGSVVIGTLSDVIFPYLGGMLFGLEMHLHLPILEETFMILGVALLGSILGIGFKITRLPHFVHVGLSVFASMFYLLAYGAVFSVLSFVLAGVVVFIAVLIPCCVSDILLPFFFLGKNLKDCSCHHH